MRLKLTAATGVLLAALALAGCGHAGDASPVPAPSPQTPPVPPRPVASVTYLRPAGPPASLYLALWLGTGVAVPPLAGELMRRRVRRG